MEDKGLDLKNNIIKWKEERIEFYKSCIKKEEDIIRKLKKGGEDGEI